MDVGRRQVLAGAGWAVAGAGVTGMAGCTDSHPAHLTLPQSSAGPPSGQTSWRSGVSWLALRGSCGRPPRNLR
jgi:hypothetical protein